ncbi:hypothetical protein BH23CHL2_BH23CHL2_11890 [soil metagenome]
MKQAIPPVDQIDYERIISTIRDGLTEEDFTVARHAGRAITLEQAIFEGLGGFSSVI